MFGETWPAGLKADYQLRECRAKSRRTALTEGCDKCGTQLARKHYETLSVVIMFPLLPPSIEFYSLVH